MKEVDEKKKVLQEKKKMQWNLKMKAQSDQKTKINLNSQETKWKEMNFNKNSTPKWSAMEFR